ncbi:hypothetical protein OHR68_18775 [Spirillospora sp. NBC_00431]
MSNSTRWTLVAVLIVVNAITNVILGDGWLAIVVSSVTGIAVVGVVLDYLLRGRGEN